MKKVKGVVAAGHEKTAEAAQFAFLEGGNAFDAAVAALMASFVAEPLMSSAAGGGFMIAHTEQGKTHLFDFFCQTPIRKPGKERKIDFSPVDIHFGSVTEEFHIGMGSIGVPGNMAGVFEIHEKLGTLPFSVLAEPAITMAREGIPVSDFQHYDFNLLEPILRVGGASTAMFFQDNEIIKAGQKLTFPEMADFLDVISHEGRRLFYEGEVAAKVAADCQQHGGILLKEDFIRYQVEIRDPLYLNTGNHKVATNPMPSAGGSIIGLLLASYLGQETHNNLCSEQELVKRLNVFSQVEKIRNNEALFEQQAWMLNQRQNGKTINEIGKSFFGSTTHFSIMDEFNNALGITTTNGQGAGYVIPGTNIMINNMMGEGALFPHGFDSWEPDKRISSLMAPTLVLDPQDVATAVLGTGGAGRIPYSIMQVVINLIAHSMNPDDAVAHPRIYIESGSINLEPGYDEPEQFPDFVKQVIRWPEKDMFFGGVHSVFKFDQEIYAVGDQRRHGYVKVS